MVSDVPLDDIHVAVAPPVVEERILAPEPPPVVPIDEDTTEDDDDDTDSPTEGEDGTEGNRVGNAISNEYMIISASVVPYLLQGAVRAPTHKHIFRFYFVTNSKFLFVDIYFHFSVFELFFEK